MYFQAQTWRWRNNRWQIQTLSDEVILETFTSLHIAFKNSNYKHFFPPSNFSVVAVIFYWIVLSLILFGFIISYDPLGKSKFLFNFYQSWHVISQQALESIEKRATIMTISTQMDSTSSCIEKSPSFGCDDSSSCFAVWRKTSMVMRRSHSQRKCSVIYSEAPTWRRRTCSPARFSFEFDRRRNRERCGAFKRWTTPALATSRTCQGSSPPQILHGWPWRTLTTFCGSLSAATAGRWFALSRLVAAVVGWCGKWRAAHAWGKKQELAII